MWINVGDIILIGLRDYQDEKADVILKYNSDEARDLKNYGELPETAQINEKAADDDEIGVEFRGLDEEELPDVAAKVPLLPFLFLFSYPPTVLCPGLQAGGNYADVEITSSEESSDEEEDE